MANFGKYIKSNKSNLQISSRIFGDVWQTDDLLLYLSLESIIRARIRKQKRTNTIGCTFCDVKKGT